MAPLRALFRRLLLVLLVITTHVVAVTATTPAKRSYGTHDYYVIELGGSAPASIHDCASALGVEVVERVGELKDHWLVRVPSSSSHDELSKRSHLDSSSPTDSVIERLQSIRRMATSSSSSLFLVSRSLRDAKRISRSIRSLERQTLRQRIKKRAPIPELPSSPFHEDPRAPVPPGGKSQRIAQELGIIDPIFNDQWHLANNPHPNFDLNVSGLWMDGITGKGVVSAVVDDGLDLNSDDLSANFVRFLLFLSLETLNL